MVESGGAYEVHYCFGKQAGSCKKCRLVLLEKKEGQNTVEYMLMLAVVVGVALLVGSLVKKMMPEVFENVKAKILGGVNSIE